MSTPIAYSSLDPGAPQVIGNNPLSVLNMLICCLVTGYIGKPGAGWSIYSFDPVNCTLVLQQGPGGTTSTSQKYLIISQPKVVTSTAAWTTGVFAFDVRGAENMSGSTPVNVFPSTNNNSYWCFMGGRTSSVGVDPSVVLNYNSNIKWGLVADDRGLYVKFEPLLLMPGGAYLGGKAIYFFGDLANQIQNDSSCIIYSNWDVTATSATATYGKFAFNDTTQLAGVSNTTGFYADPFISMNNFGGVNAGLWASRQISQNFNPINLGTESTDGLFLQTATINTLGVDAFNKTVTLSNLFLYEQNGAIRGTFPGLYVPSTNLFNYPAVAADIIISVNNIPMQFWHYTTAGLSATVPNTEVNSLSTFGTGGRGDDLRVFIRLDSWGR